MQLADDSSCSACCVFDLLGVNLPLACTLRPIIKDHISMVLRAENVSTKYEWITRMMRAMAGPLPVAAPQQQQQPPADAAKRQSKGEAVCCCSSSHLSLGAIALPAVVTAAWS